MNQKVSLGIGSSPRHSSGIVLYVDHPFAGFIEYFHDLCMVRASQMV